MDSGSGNVPEYSVSELSGAVKRSIEDTFGFVRVRGEVGRVSRPGSGHVYLDLKDEKAVLNGVIWKGQVSRLNIQPEQGLEVICTGRLTTFPGQSRYQIIIESMEPAGLGALMALLEERRKKLGAEGLFAEDRKKALPYLPEVIGVVTSPSGAVIRDILHRLGDRFPRHVLIWPVLVQGDKAADQVAAAIRGFNELTLGGEVPRPDVLIVARGGGSVEDLWAFNEEAVVRATAESDIPLISAVGHETDTTLIDFASDRRAPTPTAAAEMAVPVRADLVAQVLELEQRHLRAMQRGFEQRRSDLRGLGRGLPRPVDLIGFSQQRFDGAAGRLTQTLNANLQAHQMRYRGVEARLRPDAMQRLVAQQGKRVEELEGRARSVTARKSKASRQQLDSVSARLRFETIQRQLKESEVALDRAGQRAGQAGRTHLSKMQERLANAGSLLNAVSFQRTLERGFVLVRTAEGDLVRSAKAAKPGADVELQFVDGSKKATISGASPAKKTKSTPNKVEPSSDPHGRLL